MSCDQRMSYLAGPLMDLNGNSFRFENPVDREQEWMAGTAPLMQMIDLGLTRTKTEPEARSCCHLGLDA